MRFHDPELLPTLEGAFAEYDADPSSFMFEITETAALEDLPAARELMETIRKSDLRLRSMILGSDSLLFITSDNFPSMW